jgi:pimeloyl-ACP methyl ester carboxylesterase
MMSRVPALLLSGLVLGSLAMSQEAQRAEPDPLLAQASTFAQLFLDGDYDRVRERMDATMQGAVNRERAAQIRAELLAGRVVTGIGDPWLEGSSAEYRRYRVPIRFESGELDLRIVFDTESRVAGLFYVAHAEPAAEGSRQEMAPEFYGHWEGSIALPGAALAVLVDLNYDGAWSGTADIPVQGAKGLPLTRIRIADAGIEFSLAGIPGDPTFVGKLIQGKISGTFTQGGQSFAFDLGRIRIPPLTRFQEPQPPFPYEVSEVTYANGPITLAGTLTSPSQGGPFPAVVLLSGSGPQDRNEEVMGHKPFLVLADHLTRAGIAVLRVDDRGVGGSSGSVSEATSQDFAGDVLAGVAFLKSRPRIDAKRIGLIGHSEGGIIAPIAASRSGDIAFVVMLAGTGVPGDEVLRHQMSRIARASGMDEGKLRTILDEQDKLLSLVEAGADDKAVREQLRKLVSAQLGEATSGSMLEDGVNQAMVQMGSPWFRFFLQYDPRAALRNVRVPVLVLNGELDLQVDPAQNVPEIRKALEEAGNKEYTVTVLPGLNHLFQKAGTGSPLEYDAIEETMNPAALDAVREWILARVGAGSGKPPAGD